MATMSWGRAPVYVLVRKQITIADVFFRSSTTPGLHYVVGEADLSIAEYLSQME